MGAVGLAPVPMKDPKAGSRVCWSTGGCRPLGCPHPLLRALPWDQQ